MVSIILSCYNSGKFLEDAIASVLSQEYKDIELIFVDDGSTDSSLSIAQSFAENDSRIKIVSKENGGLNSARNFGTKFISPDSEVLLFFDADDILDKRMVGILYDAITSENKVGAAYCTFKNIDENGAFLKGNNINKRLVPTKYWFRKLPDLEKYTPFFSIYSWTLMVEACTMIKRDLFFKYGGWDENEFPKGDTFGESIPLFGQIALNHKIIFVNEDLYLYRKHSSQITSSKFDMNKIQEKIDKMLLGMPGISPANALIIMQAIKFNKYRLPLYNYIHGSMKHELRYHPLKACRYILINISKYIYSLIVK